MQPLDPSIRFFCISNFPAAVALVKNGMLPHISTPSGQLNKGGVGNQGKERSNIFGWFVCVCVLGIHMECDI